MTGGELEPGLRRIRGGTGIPRHYFKALLGASRKGLACDCLQASERRLAGRSLDRLFAECRPLGGTDRDRLFPGAARQHRAPRRESGRCRVLEIGTGVFFHRRASLSREHFRYSMRLGSVRGDMNLAGRVFRPIRCCRSGRTVFPGEVASNVRGGPEGVSRAEFSGSRFSRLVRRVTELFLQLRYETGFKN